MNESPDQVARLFRLACGLIEDWDHFLARKGAGAGDHATNAFMRQLRAAAVQTFGEDHSEKRISGPNKLAVDFFFRSQCAVVEVAMSLRNPQSEFEHDILKVVLAQDCGHEIERLVFFSKPGALARCNQPGFRAFRDWAERERRLSIEILEFAAVSEGVLDEPEPADTI